MNQKKTGICNVSGLALAPKPRPGPPRKGRPAALAASPLKGEDAKRLRGCFIALAAVVARGHEGGGAHFHRHGLAAHDGVDARAHGGMLRVHIGQGDGLVEARAQQAAGDFADLLAVCCLQLGVLAHGYALQGDQPHALAGQAGGVVELPEVGAVFAQKDTAGVVESVKAAADVYMPVSGEVIEINEALRDDPSLANSDPLGAGWFFKVKLSNPSEIDALMDETSYTRLTNPA